MKVTAKKDLVWTKLQIKISRGETVEVFFNEASPDCLFISHPDHPNKNLRCNLVNANRNFGSPFKVAPSFKTLEKWVDDGIAKSVTGKKVEPDGFGSDGSPSWLLVLGLI